MLALTSPTGGGRCVGIVRSRTKATEFSLVWYCRCVFRVPNKRKCSPSAHRFAVAIVKGSYLFRLLYDSLLHFSYRQAWWWLLYVAETCSFIYSCNSKVVHWWVIFFYYLYRSAVGPTHLLCTTGTVCTAWGSTSCTSVDVAVPCHARTAGKLQLKQDCSDTWSFLLRQLQRPLWFLTDFHINSVMVTD